MARTTARKPARKAASRTRKAASRTTSRAKARKPAAKTTAKTATKSPALKPADKTRTKTDVIRTIAEQTGLQRKDVQGVFESMRDIMAKDLSKRGPGEFNVPGLMKVKVQTKPARKAGVRPNPFKPGEMMKVKAKPAQRVVKVRPLKGLKELA